MSTELRKVGTDQRIIRIDEKTELVMTEAAAMLERAIATSDAQVIRALEATKETMKGCEAAFNLENSRKIIFSADGSVVYDFSQRISLEKDK